MAQSEQPAILKRGDAAIAYHHSPGKSPGVIFCGGFMSDMEGTKALALEAWCRAEGRQFTRFDYQGHGQSSGVFAEGTIGIWSQDAIAVLDEVARGDQVVVGSSMGGWIMLLMARARPERLAGLVGIAPAPDFVLRMWDSFDADQQAEMRRNGFIARPSDYSDEPYIISLNLIEDGRKHLVADRPIALRCPLRILHGMRDPDVPWRLSLELLERIEGEDVSVEFVKGGDHRLSEPADLRRLIAAVAALCEEPA